jgi:hypothetical protein
MPAITRFLLLCFSLSVAGVAYGSADDAGRVEGRVYNRTTGDAIPGANVVLVGTTIGGISDTTGRFVITGVPDGQYQVRVSVIGYLPLVLNGIEVMARKPQSLRCPLQEAPVQFEQSEVNAEYSVRTPDLPMSIKGLTSDEIGRQPGGFDDVVRTVSILPGIARVEDGRNDLIVRGGAPSENLYLVDGFSFPTINHFSTQGVSGGPVSFINVDFVDKTSFSAGGFGVRYGDKLSSVLNIDLKNGRTDRLGGKIGFSATQFGASAEGPLSDNGSGFIAFRRTYLDFLFKAAGLPFVPEYYDMLGKATYRLDGANTLSFVTAGALDYIHMFNETAKDRSDNAGILQSNQHQLVGGLALRHQFSSGYLRASIGLSYIDYDDLQSDSLLIPIFTASSKERELSFGLEYFTQPWRQAELLIGTRYVSVQVSSHTFLRAFTTTYGEDVSATTISKDTLAGKSAFFVQLSQQLTDRLDVTAGGRYDRFGLLRSGDRAALRFSSSYLLAPSFTLTGSIGRYYQTPSYVWLISNGANSSLAMIRMDHAGIGLEKLFPDSWKMTLEGYVKRYADYPVDLLRPYIIQSNTGAGYDYGFADNFSSFGFDPLGSRGAGRARGIELCLQKLLTSTPLYGLLSMTLSDVVFTALDGIERPGAFDQRFVLNLAVGAKPNIEWEYGIKFRLATGKPYTPFTADGGQELSRIYSERFPLSHSLDVRVDRRWQFSSWMLGLYIDVQNIYNKKNETYIRYNHHDHQAETQEVIGILPTIGISAEF